MIDVNQLHKGVTFMLDGELFKVLTYQHTKPGRGNASIRTRLRNMRSGSTIEKTFQSGDRVQDIRLEHQTVQYLYTDGGFLYFMDTRTYEQFPLPNSVIEDAIPFLTENIEIELASYEGEHLDVELPITVDLQVIDAPVCLPGDVLAGATREVTLETGMKLQAPLFVNKGDIIRVDTRDGKYLRRV